MAALLKRRQYHLRQQMDLRSS